MWLKLFEAIIVFILTLKTQTVDMKTHQFLALLVWYWIVLIVCVHMDMDIYCYPAVACNLSLAALDVKAASSLIASIEQSLPQLSWRASLCLKSIYSNILSAFSLCFQSFQLISL